MMGRCALTVRQQIPLQQTVTTYNFQACRAGKLLRCLQKKKTGRKISCVCSVCITQVICPRHPVCSSAKGITVALYFLHDNQ